MIRWLAALIVLVPSLAWAGAFDSLPANTWQRANPPARAVAISKVHPTDATQPDRCLETVTRGEPATRTYSGLSVGAGKVFNFGGGHGSHPGNDIELFDPGTGAWQSEGPPECPGNGSPAAQAIVGAGGSVTWATPGGEPFTQHSYRQCANDTVRSRMICVFASGTWGYSFATKRWTRYRHAGESPQWQLGYGGVVYDAKADRVLAFVTSPNGNTKRGVYVFYPVILAWAYRGPFPGLWADRTPIAAFDRDRGETLLHVGSFGLWRYAYATQAWGQVTHVPGIVGDGYANFDYDTLNRVFAFLVTPLAGQRDAAVWIYDPATGAWAQEPPPAQRPPAFLYSSGVEMGHFVYVPEANVFVYVESQSLYCGIGGAWGCGGLTQTWIYRYRPAAPPPEPPQQTVSIPLTVTEPGFGATGIPRVNAPVRGGLPLPSSPAWALMDGTTEIPVQVTPLLAGWALVEFQATLPGLGSKTYTLESRPSTVSHPFPVTVTENASTLQLGSMTYDKTKPPHDLRLVLPTGTLVPADPPASWTQETCGPLRCTYRVEGAWPGGAGYTVRLSVWAGQLATGVEVTYRNSRASVSRPDKILSLFVGTGGTPVRVAALGAVQPVACATGCTVDLIPAAMGYIGDVAANQGLPIADASHWRATAILAWDTLSTDAARGWRHPLVARASPDHYASLSGVSTLADEQKANTTWGYAWTADQLPTVPHRERLEVGVQNVEVHADTESDDLWQNLAMYLRTGQRGYYDRAQGWASYFITQYPYRSDGWTYGTPRLAQSVPLTAADKTHLAYATDAKVDLESYLADHFWGWGLLDWYLFTGEPAALDAATDLLEVSRSFWGPLGGYTFVYGMRNIARHLLFATRLTEVTGNTVAASHADHLVHLLLTTASWSESWGMYLWPNSSSTRPKALSAFHIAWLHEAMTRYAARTGHAEVKRRLGKMADFAFVHGLHPTMQVGSWEVAVDYPAPGQVWQQGATNPWYSVVWVDTLVRQWQATGDRKYLDRAALHWRRATELSYGGTWDQPNAGPHQVGKTQGFLNNRLGDCCAAPDSIYFSLNGYLPYAAHLHRAAASP